MTDTDESARRRIQDLFNRQPLAVLSTQDDGRPYASLVAFMAAADLTALFFPTDRSTRKFNNLATNPWVAMLIDSRTNHPDDFEEAIAVTATGTAEEVPEPERGAAVSAFLNKHPHLTEFVTAPSSALVRVRVDYYYLVSRFQNVVAVRITD